MVRFTLAAIALVLPVFSQDLPAIRWVTEVDASGKDSLAGLGVDAQGNSYVSGSTYSAAFAVKAAVQKHSASAGLYRIDGPGPAYAALGLTDASSITADPLNANTLYATSGGAPLKSTDGGATFRALAIPSSNVLVIAIHPMDDRILYAGTSDQGILKSTDVGATWVAANTGLSRSYSQFATTGIWIDPSTPDVLFAETQNDFVRSTDAGASWQILKSSTYVTSVSFDSANPGTLYATGFNVGLLTSTDHGQTITTTPTPTQFVSVIADPQHSRRLLAAGSFTVFESGDGGATWTPSRVVVLAGTSLPITPDWANGYFYAVISTSTVVRVSSDLQTVTPVGPPEVGNVNGISVANGRAYVAVSGTRDVYVTKLDPSGNVIYSTYFGGSSDDFATAMTVDPAGNVYVTGTTASFDFPVTKGAYASKGGSFLFRLNPDGTVGYSTYFANAAPSSIAVDQSGSVYLAGSSGNGLPVTPGAYQTACNCDAIPTLFLTIFRTSGFVTKFNPAASSLTYSTYVGGTTSFASVVNAFAVGPDGTVYLGGPNGIFHLDGTGSSLLKSLPATINATVLNVAPDGAVYAAGAPGSLTASPFQTTPGAFEPTAGPPPALVQGSLFPAAAIEKWDAKLATLLAATYFGGSFNQIKTMTADAAGNLYLGGSTAPRGLPTRTPFQAGFATTSGFLSQLSGDLSTLVFSSYLGDTDHFAVQGVAAGATGNIIVAGTTGQVDSYGSGPMNIYVNSLVLTPPPSLRIDAVKNAASMLDGQISAGETFVVEGAGFGSDPQLTIEGAAIVPISITPTAITAVVPQGLAGVAAHFQVQAGGGRSNAVLIPVGATSPGIFSQNGAGYGQAYILNKDGTLNTPSNPAAPGDNITIFATGVGPVSFNQGYAVTGFPVSVFVGGFYATGVAAVMGPVAGFPGDVYQITVTIPNPAALVANNPNLANFRFPPQVAVTMQIDGATSQNGITISISQ